jgi:HD-GYP domain-containing protein (c-di-GMP phosphodiesterase class II)
MACDHSGARSGACQYLRASGQLRLVFLCDECGAERGELATVAYRPRGRRLVGHLVELTARELGLGEARIARVRRAALICDVGRELIPSEILDKRGALTPEEWAEVRREPELGAAVLSNASFDDIRDWVLSRRERVDGTGYPRGLHDEGIPLEARIVAVVEAYVAMTGERAHIPARRHEDAVLELLSCAGTQFDAQVVHGFVRASVGRTAPRASPLRNPAVSAGASPRDSSTRAPR